MQLQKTLISSSLIESRVAWSQRWVATDWDGALNSLLGGKNIFYLKCNGDYLSKTHLSYAVKITVFYVNYNPIVNLKTKHNVFRK